MIHFNDGDELLLVLEALSNPHRLRIISTLFDGKQYVSQLARELGISRPFLYLHLRKLEEVNLVSSSMEVSENGKALKFYMLSPFHFVIDEKLIYQLASSLTIQKRN